MIIQFPKIITILAILAIIMHNYLNLVKGVFPDDYHFTSLLAAILPLVYHSTADPTTDPTTLPHYSTTATTTLPHILPLYHSPTLPLPPTTLPPST